MSLIPDFDGLYARDPDPWRVATSWYERRKTDLVLASLRRERYRLAWDVACGTGELAARLAPRCDTLLATDSSVEACALARARLADAPHVRVEPSALPESPPLLPPVHAGAAPDLLVVSEVLYYLDAAARRRTWELLDETASADADLVAVHWIPHAADMLASGVEVQRELDDELRSRRWGRLVAHIDMEFVLSVWSRDVPEQVGR